MGKGATHHPGKDFGKGDSWQKGEEVVKLKHRRQINASAGAKWAKKLSLRRMSEKMLFCDFFRGSKSKPQRGSQMSGLKWCKKWSQDLQNSSVRSNQQICHPGMNMGELSKYLKTL